MSRQSGLMMLSDMIILMSFLRFICLTYYTFATRGRSFLELKVIDSISVLFRTLSSMDKSTFSCIIARACS